ncbi:MAG TPA: phosphopyruvate hydratase [Mycobacteriales bacterium]|nr:phosphopyruvate hydratase [Mycobacteriales bacterium]
MAVHISDLHAIEILDSRARPTLRVTMTCADGAVVHAGVPSGASTGTREARERRDGDTARYAGQGVLGAVASVNGEIADALRGVRFETLADLDQVLIDLDGSANKERLGANAIVGVSMAAARAFAAAAGSPLWRSFVGTIDEPRLPVPHFNVINGGAHARNGLDFQEFMIAPLGAPSAAEAVRMGAEIYAALRVRLAGRGLSVGLGDEGGYAPELVTPEDVLTLLVEAIHDAGHTAGYDGVALAMDPAATGFYQDGAYHLAGDALTSEELIDRYVAMADRFPIWLIEDGLAESDWAGWGRLTGRLGDRLELVGDDIFCTNPAIIAEAIDRKVANASLIKVNQIGTVTETLEAMRTCQRAGYRQFVSHRSGETDDSFIADLAVGTGSGHMKSGAPARGERVAKYNRLIEIEDAERLPFGLG